MFLAFLRQIEQAVHPDLDVHLILDNSSTHKTQKIRNWFLRRPRFHLHFTPTSASWLNAVETWFSQLERRSLYRNSFTSVQELRNEIRRYIRVHNQHLAKPFKWRANATSILDKVERAQRSIDQCSQQEFLGQHTSALSGKFTPLLRASFRRQLCCATSKYSRHCCVARLTDDENPSRINDTNFPDSTLG